MKKQRKAFPPTVTHSQRKNVRKNRAENGIQLSHIAPDVSVTNACACLVARIIQESTAMTDHVELIFPRRSRGRFRT